MIILKAKFPIDEILPFLLFTGLFNYSLFGQDVDVLNLKTKAQVEYDNGSYTEAIITYNKLIKHYESLDIDSFGVYQLKQFKTRNKLNDPDIIADIENWIVNYSSKLKLVDTKFGMLSSKLEALINERQIDQAKKLASRLRILYGQWHVKEAILYSNLLKMSSFVYLLEGNEDSTFYFSKLNLDFLKKNFI